MSHVEAESPAKLLKRVRCPALLRRCLRRAAPALWLCALTAVVTKDIWHLVWISGIPRAWDGTGHYGIARIYNDSIFPDTFGWTNAYFTGMPLPNFYPPLFYWLVSLLTHTHLVSFESAFKLVLCLPILFLPVVIWGLAFKASGRDEIAGIAATVPAILFMVDLRSWTGGIPTGLDYYSTFLVGLYTQPLGFVFLILWLLTYQKIDVCGRVRFSISSLLLALAILANFFISITAAFFVAATVGCDLYEYLRAANGCPRVRARRKLAARALSPLASFSLALFWLLPMLKSYEYLATRPYFFKLTDLISPTMWGLYALSVVGFILWGRRRNSWFAPYTVGCLGLAAAISFTTLAAPRWFPLQPQRFIGALNLLLCVPVGYACARVYRFFYGALREPDGEDGAPGDDPPAARGSDKYFSYANAVLVILITVDALLFVHPPYVGVGFYPRGGGKDVQGVLSFASTRKDGLYLVEADLPEGPGKFDARAINAYLGAQGNRTLSAIFHEASPNSLYFLPLINAFSGKADSFGISSRLTDDLDFAKQSFALHVERARLFGVRYLVIRSPEVKLRIEKEVSDAQRYDFDGWSVYELGGVETPAIRALPYKPALVVGRLNLKQRRRDENGFVRLAEEQLADNWFDVLLLRSNERKIDRLENLDRFGALIVEDYAYDDESAAYELLSRYAARHLLILLPGESALFERIRSDPAALPNAKIIDSISDGAEAREGAQADNAADTGATGNRPLQEEADLTNDLLNGVEPAVSYQSDPIRKQWIAVRNLLDANKEPAVGCVVGGNLGQDKIELRVNDSPTADVPVLIANSFHSSWHRDDGEQIYAATPFHMVTFIRQSTGLIYGRDFYEVTALWVSVTTLALLLVMLARGLSSVRRV